MSEELVNNLDKSKFSRKRTATQKEMDMLEIERWHLKGKTCREISLLLADIRPYKISHQQVAHDLDRIRKRWQAERRDLIDEHVAYQLRAIQGQLNESWEAYERSKGEHEVRSVQTAKNGEASRTLQRMTTERRVGDPRWQMVISELHKRQCALLGLDRPQKLVLEGGEQPIKTEEVGDFPVMNKGELKNLLASLGTTGFTKRN